MSAEDFSTLSHISPALTNEKVTKALTQWFQEDVDFTHWEYANELGKGDSYLSELIRIRIFGKNKDDTAKRVQVILKYMPKSVAKRLTYRSDEFFRNEINFYEIVLPALLKFQATKDLIDPFNNCAKLFLAYCDGTNDFICLEDVGLQSFGPAVRQEGIDYEHCKTTFEVLAKFHAISYAMKDQEAEDFDVIRNAIFETYCDGHLWEWYERYWNKLCAIAIDAVEQEYPNSIYLEKVKKFAVPERYKDMVKAAKTYETGTISHGDCWTSNFLYKYTNERPVNAIMVDFQFARCANPILDISFAIYACTTQDMRLKYYDELLKYYYDVLSRQIKEMGSDPNELYSWEMFMGDVKKYSFFGLAYSFESTPFIVLAPEDAVNMEVTGDKKMNIADVVHIVPFKTKEGRLREANNVVHCVDNGFI